MPELNWDESKSVGFAAIDEQHKVLFGIFNTLCRAMDTGQEWPTVNRAVTELLDYTVTHFRDEERLMRYYNYPDIVRHLAEHAAFLDKVGQFEFGKMMRDPGLANEIFMFLTDWLVEHISTVDVDMGKFIRQSAAK
jgi:hemerythrin-like metal-binding protein